MRVGARKSSFSLESRGTVVEHCRKCTVGRRRVSLSSWIFVLGPVEMAAAVLQCTSGSNGVGRSRTPWPERGRAH